MEIDQIKQQISQMSAYLEGHVHDGELKDKLFDQLQWLRYQISFHAEKGNHDLIEENFEWVVSNFQHDLRVNSQSSLNQLFKKN